MRPSAIADEEWWNMSAMALTRDSWSMRAVTECGVATTGKES
jgi:hypothetical protein